jgi:hypothetical protein
MAAEPPTFKGIREQLTSLAGTVELVVKDLQVAAETLKTAQLALQSAEIALGTKQQTLIDSQARYMARLDQALENMRRPLQAMFPAPNDIDG